MKVTLFRDLPSEHWWSMERYSTELEQALLTLGVNVRSYVLPRPGPRLQGRANAWLNIAWRHTAYGWAARRQQGDVNHILDHSYAHLLRHLDPTRTVVTCHDIAPLALDEGRGLTRRLWDAAFQQMQRAAHVITVSNNTRSEVLRFAHFPPERLTPVWYGVGPEFAPLGATPLPKEAVVVHVGSCVPRKNVEAVIRALPALRDTGVRWAQIGGSFTQTQRALIAALDVQDVVQQWPPVSGTDLRAWYHRATVFVFPSLYEGFGLPVLEAMACGTPVVSSNVSSLPEVAGDAALLVDPYDINALSEAVRSILSDAGLGADLSQRGQNRARKFTWEETARQTLAIYARVYKGGA